MNLHIIGGVVIIIVFLAIGKMEENFKAKKLPLLTKEDQIKHMRVEKERADKGMYNLPFKKNKDSNPFYWFGMVLGVISFGIGLMEYLIKIFENK